MKKILVLITILLSFEFGLGQNNKQSKFLGEPIITDSTSTLMIPIRYNESSKNFKFGSNFYANIVFYDFITDSSKNLFKENKYIKPFDDIDNNNYYRIENKLNISKKYIFFFVKEDYNKNEENETEDPYILYVTDKQGNGLTAITPVDKNAVSINIYDKLGFALIKMQKDSNNDKSFDNDDKEYYFLRLDLKTLKLGNKIEINYK